MIFENELVWGHVLHVTVESARVGGILHPASENSSAVGAAR
jgi:hypothetical protein